ncbi:MAG: hypothetical protein HY764_01415 [Candidatus Portnoybacteria bacterium]|nr:hypothetical protein [Candidatus Portnoybacteria bacterium]
MEKEFISNGFILALNSLRDSSSGQLLGQLNTLYRAIGELDANGTFAAYQTLVTARELYELNGKFTEAEEMLFRGMRRALQIHMTALEKKSPSDAVLKIKRNTMYFHDGFSCKLR